MVLYVCKSTVARNPSCGSLQDCAVPGSLEYGVNWPGSNIMRPTPKDWGRSLEPAQMIAFQGHADHIRRTGLTNEHHVKHIDNLNIYLSNNLTRVRAMSWRSATNLMSSGKTAAILELNRTLNAPIGFFTSPSYAHSQVCDTMWVTRSQ